jgi:hypothetical protein
VGSVEQRETCVSRPAVRQENPQPCCRGGSNSGARRSAPARVKVAPVGGSQHRHLEESRCATIAPQRAAMTRGARTYLTSIDGRPQAESAQVLNVSRPSLQGAGEMTESACVEKHRGPG